MNEINKMKSFLVLLFFTVKIVTSISITNKLNDLLTTPISTDLNDNESLTNVYIDGNNSSNESIDYSIKISDDFIDEKLKNEHKFNESASRDLTTTSDDPVQSIAVKQKAMPQKRSLFGFILIPC